MYICYKIGKAMYVCIYIGNLRIVLHEIAVAFYFTTLNYIPYLTSAVYNRHLKLIMFRNYNYIFVVYFEMI